MLSPPCKPGRKRRPDGGKRLWRPPARPGSAPRRGRGRGGVWAGRDGDDGLRGGSFCQGIKLYNTLVHNELQKATASRWSAQSDFAFPSRGDRSRLALRLTWRNRASRAGRVGPCRQEKSRAGWVRWVSGKRAGQGFPVFVFLFPGRPDSWPRVGLLRPPSLPRPRPVPSPFP